MSFTTEFRDFVLRGNVVDLAVAVVIGGAFTSVVTALTKDMILPFTAIAHQGTSKVDFEKLTFTLGNSTFNYGDFLNTVVSFILIALIVFIFVVKPVNWLMSRVKTKTPEPEITCECPECLSKIPLAAKRCAFCTAEVGAAV